MFLEFLKEEYEEAQYDYELNQTNAAIYTIIAAFMFLPIFYIEWLFSVLEKDGC